MKLYHYFIIAIGISAVIVGGVDDSPGLQGIGAVIIIGTIYRLYRRR